MTSCQHSKRQACPQMQGGQTDMSKEDNGVRRDLGQWKITRTIVSKKQKQSQGNRKTDVWVQSVCYGDVPVSHVLAVRSEKNEGIPN